MIRWLKLYDEITDDMKAQSLPGETFKFWINILAVANKQKVRGILPPTNQIAFALRLTTEDAESRLAELVSLGMVDETPEGLTPHNWKERQKRQDATSTERSRRHREKRAGNATRCGTPMQRVASPLRDASGTPVGRKCNEMQRTDREEEKKEYTTPRISEHTKPVEAKSIPPQGELDSPKFESQPARTPEDLADIRAAEKILRADLRTDALAERLTREHSLRANIKVAGWKWIRAAEKMTSSSVTDSQRKQFNYFASIAANTSNDERAAKPRQFASDESVPYRPTPAKNVYVSRKSRERLAKLAEMGIAV